MDAKHLRNRSGSMGMVVWGVVGVLAVTAVAGALETPSSSGEVATVETPLWRIPFAQKVPEIDGVMQEGEWEDSSALSAFWYWNFYVGGHYDYMAPFETQLQVYACYDKENLYVAFTSPVYPEGSWLRALGRFPDVIEHPLYGIYRDDYVGLGIRPYFDDAKSYQMGSFGWFINCISVVGDYGPGGYEGGGRKWDSNVVTRGTVTRTRWVQEFKFPMETMLQGPYAQKDEQGKPLLTLPPPDGTTWCFRLDRCDGEWGVRGFHNKFCETTSKMILDSKCVSVQINELGPIMEDVIDLRLTVKNHSDKSETVRLGFFVESAEGTIYSSYEDDQLQGGLLELVPGEVRKLHLTKPIPGITMNGNFLWFDVRSAGRPAKPIFVTRLIDFHSQDRKDFRRLHIDGISANRPPRKDFDVRLDHSYHTGKVSAVVDTGIHGASDEAQTAKTAKLTILDASAGDREVATATVPFRGPFACVVADLPPLIDGHEYRAVTLLFDRNMRIVGEDSQGFAWAVKPYMNNEIGLEDVVWEPYAPIEPRPTKGGAVLVETVKQIITVDRSGLPAQVYIKPDPRDLPLEMRARMGSLTDADLLPYGRGNQLRNGGYRLEAVVGGERVAAQVVEPARLVRQWRSELEYVSKLRVGPVDVALTVRYDCDGSMAVRMDYGADAEAVIDLLELVCDYQGPMDMTPGAGVEGVVWDSANEDPELYYTHFVPWRRFGSNERAFSWICRNEGGWLLDRDGSGMTLERDEKGEVTWRVKFVNHTRDVRGRRSTEFQILTHPSKSRPERAREHAWFYRGDIWAREYMMNIPLLPETIERMNQSILAEDPHFEPYKDAEDYLRRDAHVATRSERGTPYEEMARKTLREPPWNRYGLCRNVSLHDSTLDAHWEDKNVYYFERQIRVGRRCGFWWDEYWPMFQQAAWSDMLASGDAVLRDPNAVVEGELPWHRGFLTHYMRRNLKRIARIFHNENLPNRNHVWAYDSASAFESFIWDIMLVEWAGSDHHSYELDSVVLYDIDRFRFLCQKWTGTIARVVPGYGGMKKVPLPGDDKRFDRQYLGRSLLHDIGAQHDGPHGVMHQPEEGVRLLRKLLDFGFFDDATCEFLPYWRNGHVIRYGPDFGDAKYTLLTAPPEKKVYATVYRRPFARDGRKGAEALIVLMNESDRPVHAPLHLLNAAAILGGPNDLTLAEVTARGKALDPEAQKLLAAWSGGSGSGDTGTAGGGESQSIVLQDLESDRYVPRVSVEGGSETYGPVYIPMHNYRVLYARSYERGAAK